MLSNLRISRQIVALLAIALMCVGCSTVPSMSYNPWEPISIPTDAKLFDIAFTGNPNHGFIVGSKAALLETQDGGETWKPIALQLDDENYRFNAIDFAGDEGWIAVEPSTLLHTNDEGKTWSSIPLSEKLPGNPVNIVALGKNSAEMATDVGAIYKTTDGGKNWKAQVAESVGVVRNIERSEDGKYIAVSGKGNFYSTWEPGQNAWVQHNRNSSRKVENMGFAQNGQMWMLARGGQIQFSEPNNLEEWLDAKYPEISTSWGLLDLAYRTPSEIWVSGGSANLLRSTDGGQTWEKDRDVENVATNFYKIVFLSPEKGFIIGDRGFLLKYQPDIAPSTESSKA
ncbi:photosynthesis system II assembly factor Ycf48 [Rivularia sp. UHCC 0363]|uniref:photosynthesis system II assembly factor Ycf48 n=1 Tax=Rivularia sp. UHCC 0363 TaxID=3110244 RepID=UPI002B20FE10|nr:photosynthesis system II assembly factor Ycf48 [Rivularia sp. UHCC 0363]MEA5596380.1 photosynthesis system II assembly factor Ycf48 [Rivularia sp. UHCC 0363]